MKTWIARRLIDRAVDDDRDPPAWVRRMLERDAALRAYEQTATRTVRLLRRDAAEWMAGAENGSANVSVRHQVAPSAGRTRPVAAALLLAAAVLIAATVGFFTFQRRQPEQDVVDQPVRPNRALADDELNRTARQLATLLATKPGPRIAAMTVEPAEAAGRFVGRSLAMLDRSLEQERGRIKSDARTAVHTIADQVQSGLSDLGFHHRRDRQENDR